MNNAVFGKTSENVRKHRDIKLVTTDKKSNQLVSKPNYHTTIWCSESLLAIEMKKIRIKMNKPVYSGFSILEISKLIIYELWYDYMKPKLAKKQHCIMWTQTALLFILKLNIFIKMLQMMLKKDLTHQIMKSTDHCLLEKTKELLVL